MRQKVMANVIGDAVYFEGLPSVGGGGAAKPGDVRKWFDAHKKKGPWACPVCKESIGSNGGRVVVYVDLDDPNCFEVVHRQHA